ncbi:Contact-dependent inhibition of growth factor CdiA, partial [Pantoea sp. VH_8]
AGKGKLNPTSDEIAKQAYDTAMKPFGTGSSLQQGISAVTAAVQGLSGGNVAQALSGAAAPYVAEKIHELTTDANGKVNTEANLMAHAVLGAVTSYASGNAALAGASGAAMGEYIAQQLYPGVKREDLSEEQRQTISALGTLAAGLAGGFAGDSTADAVAGAQAGKTSLENNNLLLPRPVVVPVPGLPMSPGDKVVQDANNNIASELDKAVKGSGTEADTPPITDGPSIVEARDEAAKTRDPNVAKALTDAEKTELGGSGSGTPGGWGPQDEENARSNKSNQNNNFDRFKKDDLVSSANEPINEQGLSAAARAWEKHAGRPGGVFEPLKGNPAQKSEAANKFVNEVLNNTNTVKTDLSRGGVEYRLPDGRGIRYNSDGSFSGFLDPKTPR